jgi:uncharacterized 2Fe-2S/4Fe-4S cluster protein (DUF4445 family)
MTEQITVTFLPEGTTIQALKGITIQQAATEAGFILNIPCGGHGECGKCRVIIKEGKTRKKGTFHQKHFSSEEIANGLCLACQTILLSDSTIYLPAHSLVRDQQILSDEIQSDLTLDPIAQRINIALPKPSKGNNIADYDRLKNTLQKKFPSQEITLPFSSISTLPTQLRLCEWTFTATLITEPSNRLLVQELSPDSSTKRLLGVAVDIGTTTIVASLVDLETGQTITTKSTFNQQMMFGEDIITRIQYASENERHLQRIQQLVIDDINQLLNELQNGTEGYISAITFSGNTIMSHLLYGLNPAHIWREPYTPVTREYPILSASDLGIKTGNKTTIFTLPSVSSYIGGDVIGDILVSGLNRKEKPSLLVDIGTNGEIVLGCKDWLLSCSVPAGPALEGAGVKAGMRAANGAIEKISLNRDTLECDYKVIGNQKPTGICGSGLIDLLSELFIAGVISKSGNFITTKKSDKIRSTKFGTEFLVVPKEQTAHSEDIVLSNNDIKTLLRTKGAFYAGCLTLLKSFNLSFNDIDSFYVAGGFGNYIDKENAIHIGLFPDIPSEKIKLLANGSLGGARAYLLSSQARKEAHELIHKITNIDLSNNYDFMDEYTLASFIPHTDLNLFPNVKRLLVDGGINY